MTHTRTTVGAVASLWLASFALAQDEGKPAPKPATPTAAEVVAAALAKAKVHNTRVLAVAPGAADDAKAIDAALKHRSISRFLLYEFTIARLDGSRPELQALAAQWQFPALADGTAIVVLDADGKPLARLGRDALFAGAVVDAGDLQKELEKHQAAPVDAQKKLDAALGQAKKTGRAVFVRFDAPW